MQVPPLSIKLRRRGARRLLAHAVQGDRPEVTGEPQLTAKLVGGGGGAPPGWHAVQVQAQCNGAAVKALGAALLPAPGQHAAVLPQPEGCRLHAAGPRHRLGALLARALLCSCDSTCSQLTEPVEVGAHLGNLP